MAGKPKIKCYEYDSNYKYLGEYESVQEVRNKYFSNDLGKRKLFESGKNDYYKLDNGNFIANYRIGRHNLLKLERIKNCVYCSTNKNIKNKEIEVFNLKGEKIAEFKNLYIACEMLKIPMNTLWNRLNVTSNLRNKLNKDNLEFKYK